jgi:cell division septation protein DedD
MTTIGSASITPEPPVLPGSEDEVPPSSKDAKKNLPLIWIPITLCVGLLLAALYVGIRILTVKSRTSAATVHAQPPATPTPRLETPATASPTVAPEEQVSERAAASIAKGNTPVAGPLAKSKNARSAYDWPIWISPERGEKYIQVGAINSQLAPKYVAQLRSEKWDPHVAPGPSPNIVRVLLGPFTDHDSIVRAKERLRESQIDSFVRAY